MRAELTPQEIEARTALHRDVAELMRKHSINAESGIHSDILAVYLMESLDSFLMTVHINNKLAEEEAEADSSSDEVEAAYDTTPVQQTRH